jgi:UDP-N-acetylglucosamine/UDP-N-acetylgalactosamine diphosphorylase
VLSEAPDSHSPETLRAEFAAHGQGHVFRFWDALDAEARRRLLRQAAALDLPALLRGYAATRSGRSRALPRIEVPPVEIAPEHGGSAERFRAARDAGEALLGEGRVGVMVVAGGQATRLGYDAPKGDFPIGPVSGRSLFALQAQKIRRLRTRFGRALPWYVMTSHATDAATRDAFARAHHYGLPKEDVFFLCQGMVPSFDFEGRLMLEQPDRIFENPDGHGGAIPALLCSGALDDMADRGIDTLFYYQVDNPLVRIADPAFLGFHALAGAEAACKVVRKRDPAEKVGVVARIDGRIGILEYTEIDEALRGARAPDGELLFWAGSIAIHAFGREFLRRVARNADALLPYHASPKAIPCIDAEGRTRQPSQANGVKLERFVFDALPAALRVSVVETLRADEYAPVKNADGPDSPATARQALGELYRRWLAAAGIALPAGCRALEIDHSRVDGPEDATSLGIARAEQARDAILIDVGGGG